MIFIQNLIRFTGDPLVKPEMIYIPLIAIALFAAIMFIVGKFQKHTVHEFHAFANFLTNYKFLSYSNDWLFGPGKLFH